MGIESTPQKDVISLIISICVWSVVVMAGLAVGIYEPYPVAGGVTDWLLVLGICDLVGIAAVLVLSSLFWVALVLAGRKSSRSAEILRVIMSGGVGVMMVTFCLFGFGIILMVHGTR